MLNKRLINTGAEAAPAAFDPLQNFETVTYTGNGGTQKITGYIRKGAAFNGSSSAISVSATSTTPVDFSQRNYSLSFWVNTTTTTQSAMLSKYGDSDSARAFITEIRATGIVRHYERGTGTFEDTSTTSTINDGDWHHIVVTKSSTQTIIYIDGTADVTNANTFTSNNGGTEDFRIGRDNPASPAWFNGKIDQVRIFDKALSSSEVTTLYGETYASSTKSTTDIFNDGSAVALYELDEDANDTGAAGTAIDSGQSGDFDGSNYLTTPYTIGTTFSVSSWFKTTATGEVSIIGNGGGSGSQRGFQVSVVSGSLKIYFSEGGTASYTSSNTHNDGLWHNVVLTDNNGTFNTYVDGVLDSNLSGTTSYYTSTTATQSTTIGRFAPSANYFFDGQIDDVRIYSSVLTSTQAGYIADNDTGNIPTPQALYKLDGNSNDSAGSNNATWSGTAAYSTPAYTGQTQYNGTPTNVNFLGMAFQPDLIWTKSRSNALNHTLFDSVRGTTKSLRPNATTAEQTRSGVTSFDSNGFTIGSDDESGGEDGYTYVSWCFKGGGSAVSNTDGDITSSVSANPDAGFSIVKADSGSSNTDTIGHGLSSSSPEMVIRKRIDGTSGWLVLVDINGTYYELLLNSTAAATSTSSFATSTTIETRSATSGNEYIWYCFHSVDGYQKVGSYTGTGSSGASVTTGFDPRFILFKNASSNNSWWIHDAVRGDNNRLFADLSDAESTSSSLTTTTTGFTLNDANSNLNASGNTYIYLAIA